MRSLARLVAAAALVAVGGLTLPGGAAQAAACSGTTGVTVVVDYGATTTTSCAPGDPASAMSALKAVATVVSPQRYPGTVVCRIRGVPASDPCIQMPPASAYWAFFHASRGGSWSYSQSGVASYNPAPGTVIGFAFGSGGAPDTAPPAAASTPKPSSSSSPRPSTKPSAPSSPKPSTKPGTKPSSRSSAPGTPRATSSTQPRSTSSSSPRGTTATGEATPAKGADSPTPGSTSTTRSSSTTGPRTTAAAPSDVTGTATGSGDVSPSTQGAPFDSVRAGAAPESGSPTTLFAGLGLVGVVGAGAAYLAHRRRTHG
ncbi:MAG: hypothetical protein ABIQ13_04835 [Pedococcus sp.]